jgi:hypothetical protein
MRLNNGPPCSVTYNPTNYNNIGVRITRKGSFPEGPKSMARLFWVVVATSEQKPANQYNYFIGSGSVKRLIRTVKQAVSELFMLINELRFEEAYNQLQQIRRELTKKI